MDAASTLGAPATALRLPVRMTPASACACPERGCARGAADRPHGRPLWLDEAYSAWFSAQSWHVLWTDVPTYETHPPFYYSLLKLWRDRLRRDCSRVEKLLGLVRRRGHAAGRRSEPGTGASAADRPPLLRSGIAGFLAACSPLLVLLGRRRGPIRCSSSLLRSLHSACFGSFGNSPTGPGPGFLADARCRRRAGACGRTVSGCSTHSASPPRLLPLG